MFCVSLCCTWDLGNRVSIQKRMPAGQEVLRVGHEPSGFAFKQEKPQARKLQHTWIPLNGQVKSWGKKVPGQELSRGPGSHLTDSLLNKLRGCHSANLLSQRCPTELSVMMAMFSEPLKMAATRHMRLLST